MCVHVCARVLIAKHGGGSLLNSGKLVITGAKSQENIEEAFDNIYAILQQFRKT